jgi:hypothetical protein
MSDSDVDHAVMLDAAAASREVAMLVALVLLATENDIPKALDMLADFAELAPPEEARELNAATIGAQAIRDAVDRRGGVDL